MLLRYTRAVIEEDWPALADDSLSDEAGELLRTLEGHVLALEPADSIQATLRQRIVADVDAIGDHRLSRLEQALSKPPIFLAVVVLGFLVTMIYFGINEPTRVLVSLLSLYTALVGVVVFLILAFSDPFQGATGIDPTPFEYMLERMEDENA